MSGTKTWKDDHDAYGTRPDDIKLILERTEESGAWVEVDDETMKGLPVPSLTMLVASASMEQELQCLLRLNPHMEFVIYTLDFRCAATIPDLFESLGIRETEVIQIAVSKLSGKNTFHQEPAPWIITGRA